MALAQYRVGDIVALVSHDGSGNGAGEGVLWRVTKAKLLASIGQTTLRSSSSVEYWKLRVEPCWCATGYCSLRPKTVFGNQVRQRIDFFRLGELRMQLEDLCRKALAHEAGLVLAPIEMQAGLSKE